MQLINYLKILRWPNLLIIILTQGLFRFCIIEPFFRMGQASPALDIREFVLLVLSTVLIASGGYVINDIFDVKIDIINKPEKVIAGKRIPIQHLKIFYWSLTVAGILLGATIAVRIGNYQVGLIFPIVAIMLWFYSSRYQKTLLTGNIIISLMSALVVLIVWVFEVFALLNEPVKYVEAMPLLKNVGWIALAYAVFAFLLSMVREILKDAEDMEGDIQQGYKTLAIAQGIKTAKIVVHALQVVTIIFLAFSQYMVLQWGLTMVFWYLLIAVQLLLIYFLFQTAPAKSREDFRFLSNVAKMIMVAGILSMQLFYISL